MKVDRWPSIGYRRSDKHVHVDSVVIRRGDETKYLQASRRLHWSTLRVSVHGNGVCSSVERERVPLETAQSLQYFMSK